MEHQLIADGFQLIVPHRPGYYGTPLGNRVTTTDCVELAAAVLNHLNVAQVAVMGTSGGGLPALAFAVQFPQRTAALILQCAQVHRWDDKKWAPQQHPWLYQCFRMQPARWFFCQFFPALFRTGFPTAELYLRDLAGPRYEAVKDIPAARRFAETVYGSLSEFRHERPGYYNDVSNWVREDILSTGDVRCPTLLIHDTVDQGAPFRHAEYAASKIPNAELMGLDAGGHLIWFGRDSERMARRRTEFLRENLTNTAA